MLETLLQAMQQPLRAFVDPAERVFIPAVLSSVVLTWLVLGLRRGSHALRHGLLTRRIWGHASSRADIVLLFVRAALFGTMRISWVTAQLSGALWVGLRLYDVAGPIEPPALPGWLVAAVYTAVLFVAWDFSRFALHWVMHRFDTLWSFHQVHHSAEVLTPLTLYRVHPVESLLYDLRGVVTTSLVTGTFLYLFRGSAYELQLLGINAIGLLINFVGGNLRHSHVWVRFGSLERVLLSPAQHQMHHARSDSLHRSNYGTWLSVWDRWAGTWQPSPSEPIESFGLDEANHRSDGVWSMLLQPFVGAARTFARTKMWRVWPGAIVIAFGLVPAAGHAAPPTMTQAKAAPVAKPSAKPDDGAPRETVVDSAAEPSPTAQPDASGQPDATAKGEPGPKPQPETKTQPGPSEQANPTDQPQPPQSPDAGGAAPHDPDAPTDNVPPPAGSEPPDLTAPGDPPPTVGGNAPTSGQSEPAPPPAQRTLPAATDSTDPPSSPAADGVDFELDLGGDEPDPSASSPQANADQEQNANADDYDVLIDSISIVGDEESRRRIGGSAFVIDEEEMERKEYDDLHRALRAAPGVYLREEDGYGLRPNIGLRGASSDRSAKVTLMEDGILLGPAPYSAPAAYYFPLVTRLASIEVFKGPSSIKYGPNTIGGAVNVLTRSIPREMEAYVDAALGMRRYGKIHAFWGTTYKGFGILIEGARVQTDGFKELPSGDDTGFDKNDFMIKLRYSSDPNKRWYHQVDIKGGFGTERSNETYLGLTDADFDSDPYQRYPSSELARMQWWRSQAEVGYFVARGSFFDLHIRGYRHDFDRAWRKFNDFRGADIVDALANPDTGQSAVFAAILRGEADSANTGQSLLIGTNDRRYEVNGGQAIAHIRPTFRILEQDIEIGARVHHDQIIRDHTEDGYLMVGEQLVRDGTPRDTTTNNRGTTVAAAFHVIDTLRVKWLTLMPGARVEVIRTEFNNRLTATETNNLNTVFLPGIGIHAQATPWLGILAGVHSGFSPVAPGQPDEVEPERSINYEVGLRVDDRERAVGTGRFNSKLEVIGFLNDYSNLTSVCTISSGCVDQMLDQQFNAGAVWVYGAEVLGVERVSLPREHFFELGVSYTYTGSFFRDTFTSNSPALGEVERGDQLPYVPLHLASINLGGGGKRWGLYPSVSIVGEMRDLPGQGSVPEAERVPLHYVVDLSGQFMPTKRTTVYLQIRNLTNNTYLVSRRPLGSRPGIPFQLSAGFKYHFGGRRT